MSGMFFLGRLLLGAGLTLVLAGVASAAEPPVVGSPVIVPVGDLGRYFPDRAARMNIGGSATVRCVVGDDLGARDCIVVGEDPSGFGFGDAAIAIMRGAKFVSPWHGSSLVGRTAIRTIPFHSPSSNRPAPGDWIQQPSAQVISRAHPAGAEAFGMADIACTAVGPDGTPLDCLAQSESPQGEGFGVAALTLANQFRWRGGALPPLRVGFYIAWVVPGSPSSTRNIVVGSAIEGPGAQIYAHSQVGSSLIPWSRVFSQVPTDEQVETVRPSGLSGMADVRMMCDVAPSGELLNCSATAPSQVDARYVSAAMSLISDFRFSPEALSQFDPNPRVVYHVNWTP